MAMIVGRVRIIAPFVDFSFRGGGQRWDGRMS
jgi:hypothetical protein